VPKKLSPGTVGGISEVMGWTSAVTVPSAFGLRWAFPEKWVSRVDVPKPDQVAGDEVNDRAIRLICCAALLSEFQLSPSASLGLFP